MSVPSWFVVQSRESVYLFFFSFLLCYLGQALQLPSRGRAVVKCRKSSQVWLVKILGEQGGSLGC